MNHTFQHHSIQQVIGSNNKSPKNLSQYSQALVPQCDYSGDRDRRSTCADRVARTVMLAVDWESDTSFIRLNLEIQVTDTNS